MIKRDLDIYRNPNVISIGGNISNKQHLLINRFFDMGFVMATADSSIVLHAPIVYFNDPRSQMERDNDYEQDKDVFKKKCGIKTTYNKSTSKKILG